MAPKLKELKMQHPEWCWNCGFLDRRGDACQSRPSPALTALTAKCLEDEATIRELEGCLIAEQEHTAQAEAELSTAQATILEKDAMIADLITQRNECARLAAEQGIKAFHLSYDLSAEQAAHAATREELRKADEALSFYADSANMDEYAVYRIPHEGHKGCKVPDAGRTARAALARIQAQRAAEPKETK